MALFLPPISAPKNPSPHPLCPPLGRSSYRILHFLSPSCELSRKVTGDQQLSRVRFEDSTPPPKRRYPSSLFGTPHTTGPKQPSATPPPLPILKGFKSQRVPDSVPPTAKIFQVIDEPAHPPSSSPTLINAFVCRQPHVGVHLALNNPDDLFTYGSVSDSPRHAF